MSEEEYVAPRQAAVKLTEAAQYDAAEAKMIPLLKVMKANNAPSLPNATQQLAWIYLLDGKYKEAEELASQAQFRHEKNDSSDVDNKILDNYTLATIYEKLGKYDESEALYRQAIELREDALKKKAPPAGEKIIDAPRLASLQLGLGRLQYCKGEYKLADAQLKEALKSAESDRVEQKPRAINVFVEVLEAIALLDAANGKYGDAHEISNQGVTTASKFVNSDRPLAISAANTMLSILSAQHQHKEADALAAALWQEEMHHLREGHPVILQSKLENMANLPYVHPEVSRDEVEAVYDRLIANFAEVYGAENVELIAPYQAAGEYELAVADYTKAEANLRAALSLARSRLRDKHPRTLSILNSLATTLGFKYVNSKSKATLDEAKKLVRESIAKQDDSLPEDNPIRARSLGTLASLYTVSDDTDAAYKTFKDYLAVSQKVSYEEPLDRIRFLKNYQKVLEQTGRHAEAQRVEASFATATPLTRMGVNKSGLVPLKYK